MRMIHKEIQNRHSIRNRMKSRLSRLFLCFIMLAVSILHPLTSVTAESVITDNITPAADQTTAEEEQGGVLHAFYPSNAVFSEKLQNYIDHLDSISFAWSRIDAEDFEHLNTVKGKNGNYGFYYPVDYLKPIEYAKSQGKSIQLNVYMEGSDCKELLPNEEERAVAIQTIVKAMQTDITGGQGIYYDGVVIDFEGLCNTNSNNEPILYDGYPISTYYTQFLTELKVQLDSIGKKLYAAVNPAIYFDGYNYSEILEVADRVIIMAHDYEPTVKLQKKQVQQYMGYDALKPIYCLAPIHMIRQALNDIMNAASDESQLSKVWLQISFDSAQWQFDIGSANSWEEIADTTLSREKRRAPLYKSIKARVDNADGYGQNITYGYNNELQTPYIQYYNSSDQSWNVIIYEDSNSIRAKIELAKDYKLGGISLWSLANVPDYSDSTGQEYHLDGWNTILSEMSSYETLPSESSKYISFTDPMIEQAVRDKLGNSSGQISAWEIQRIYRLKLPQGVTSLKDMKKFTNLEYLDASNLNLKSITPLGGLKKLRVLYLQRNMISDISVLKKMSNLEVLSLNGNQIADLKPLSKLKSLRKLYLKENKIKSIVPLKGLVNLKELYLAGNSITDYSPGKSLYSIKGFLCDFEIE